MEDDLVTTALGNTAYYTFIAVPLHVVAALGLAILLNNRMKGIGIPDNVLPAFSDATGCVRHRVPGYLCRIRLRQPVAPDVSPPSRGLVEHRGVGKAGIHHHEHVNRWPCDGHFLGGAPERAGNVAGSGVNRRRRPVGAIPSHHDPDDQPGPLLQHSTRIDGLVSDIHSGLHNYERRPRAVHLFLRASPL